VQSRTDITPVAIISEKINSLLRISGKIVCYNPKDVLYKLHNNHKVKPMLDTPKIKSK
jgi:hypothetical protein